MRRVAAITYRAGRGLHTALRADEMQRFALMICRAGADDIHGVAVMGFFGGDFILRNVIFFRKILTGTAAVCYN